MVDQNALIEDGSHELKNATKLNLATVGILNGVIDVRAMAKGFGDFAVNNTYGIKFWDDKTTQDAIDSVTKKGGCYDAIDACRAEVAKDDPEAKAKSDKVNEACKGATLACGPLAKTLIQEQSLVSHA